MSKIIGVTVGTPYNPNNIVGGGSQNTVNKWKGKTLNFMGDSITEGYASTLKFTDVIAIKLSATCNNYGIGGSTVADGQNPMYSRVLNMDENADLCVVFGGTNDFANYDRVLGEQFVVNNGKRTLNVDTSTFYGGLNQLCINLYKRFPYSTLVLCTPLNRQSFAGQETDMQSNSKGLYLDEYVNAIKKVSAYFGIPCLDLYATANLYPYDSANISKYYSTSDQLHPNAEGHKHLANVMLAFFETLADKRGKQSGTDTDTHTHNYTSEVTTPATCTTNGVKTFTCSCGESYTESIPMISHNYTEGVCSVCGAVDTNYKPDVILSSISATYTGGNVNEGTVLSDLTGIVVTAHYSDGSTQTVTGYTLNGEIAVGENTITVNYSGFTTTFIVVGVERPKIEYSVADMSGVLEVKEHGYYNNQGNWIGTSTYQAWKIPCKAGDMFTQYSTTALGMFKHYRDINDVYITGATPPDGSPTIFTVPNKENIAYMWTAVANSDVTDGSFKLIKTES
jgi:lysophospholipase L1-like esterase